MDLNDLRINPSEWHNQSVRWGHPIHSMCSYMASFPPRVPHYFIEKFTKPGDAILDPFCGRGTTPTEACLMGRKGIGIDLNPMAYVLTKAKVNPPLMNNVKKRLDYLEDCFEEQDISDVPEKIGMLYSPETLNQLLFLKKELNYKKSLVDNFILAIILGGMHGNSNLPSYMSIKMPNTFSMSPNYVKKYITEKKLIPPKHDAFDVIKHRFKKYHYNEKPPINGEVHLKNSREMSKIVTTKIDMIFTSPPYLKVIKYGKFNWIRLWMLEEDSKKVDKKLDATHPVPEYMMFMNDVINEMGKVLKEDGLAFIVVGQVNGERGRGKGKNMRLGNQIQFRLKNKINLEILGVIDDKYNRYLRVKKNVSRIWGKTQGKATRYDQIIVLSKDRSKIPNRIEDKVKWTY